MSDDMLSKKVLDALVAVTESVINKDHERNIHDTQIVITIYGKNKQITHTSVHLFSKVDWAIKNNPARDYCEKINSLTFEGDEWIFAKMVNENEINEAKKPVDFGIFLGMRDLDIQKVLRAVDSATLTLAFINIDNDVREKVFKNMSKRAVVILKEDMECLGPVRLADVTEAKQKVLSAILHLVDVGEIKESDIKGQL